MFRPFPSERVSGVCVWRVAGGGLGGRKEGKDKRGGVSEKRRRVCLWSEDMMKVAVGRAPDLDRDRSRGAKLVYEMPDEEFVRCFRVTRITFFQLADKV